jgi:D-alanyl-D-alanine carboxypeptidase (penicillin-binding protein 5/6)|tara:strand:- start:5227 stop:6366 length:1140 start_codon:yes stop_codon:yes gene_type:complete
MKKILFLLLSLISFESLTQSFIPNTPTLDLKSYILMEPNTNTIIASFNEDAPIEPASMTKVMSSYVIADQIANDFLSLDDSVLISEKAWRMEGSKMFIEQGKRVNVLDLLKGVIIQSGNDATVALAEYVGGTEDGFVDLMNSYAASMGLSNTLFQNSTGLPDGNHFSSAQDLATMTSLLINNFPETYSLYKEKYYEFNNIRQPNRNRLLWKDNSSDGVKTGHTESAGYCLISSAKRNDMRLIAVVAGAKSDKERFNDTQRLLEYGFRFYSTQEVIKKNKALKDVSVWGGKKDLISLGAENDIKLTLPRTTFRNITISYDFQNNLRAPIKEGQTLGTLIIKDGEKTLHTENLIALSDVEAKGFFGRLWASFVLWFRGLFS